MPTPEEFSCTCDTTLGWVFGCSRTGASHENSGKPCEDSYALWSGSSGGVPCIALAVADGHGDPRHDQSRAGAALGAQAAIEELSAFHRMHPDNSSRVMFRSDFKTDFPRRVTRRWREMVEQDARQRNIVLPGQENSRDTLFVRYGTTLIAALVISDTILVGQIGDGDLILVRPDGTIECPLPKDPLLTGKETYSISSRDAHLLWRTATLDRDTGGVLIAATDGISDSFDDTEGEEFYVFIRSIVDRIRTYGMEKVAGSMSGWLDRYSTLASGDDMTLVYACIHPKPARSRDPLTTGDAVIKPFEGW